MTSNLSDLSFDDILKRLQSCRNMLLEKIKTEESRDIDEVLTLLKEKSDKICYGYEIKPESPRPEYLKQWKDYLKGEDEEPTLRVVRYLCWDSDIASSKEFLEYIYKKQETLRPRSLVGIVRACHMKWKSSKDNREIVKSLLIRFKKGSHKIIDKWNKNNNSREMILGLEGHKLFADEMVRDYNKIKEYLESWAVDEQTEYFSESIWHAVNLCMRDTNKIIYLFTEILHWQLWEDFQFRHIIKFLILDNFYNNNESSKEILINFVKSDNRLGDPRLPRNETNWFTMDNDEARSRFIQWLAKEDIEFFINYVLPKDSDKHDRRFWLGYLKNCKDSQIMLCQDDENKIKRSESFKKGELKISHLGRTKNKHENSVLLLDFGTIVAVEFSFVGAVYLYEAFQFKEIMPNFRSKDSYSERDFKVKDKCIVKFCHTESKHWQDNVRNILAQHDIRPE
ncbi:MAG: hypothetical protein HQK91_03290 [Nitrospirae bacterium]|nr:hypothetical protein [Nitrospirota bacterium]